MRAASDLLFPAFAIARSMLRSLKSTPLAR
jgi:hypothetical protein